MASADGGQQEPVIKRARGGDQEIPQDASDSFPDDGGQQQQDGSILAVPDCPQVLGGGQQMPERHCEEAESEDQKSLPFNFRASRLQLTQDKSNARIFWQSSGQIIADHKHQMVKSIGKDNRTSLVSSLMAPTDAQQKLQTLLAALGKGTSWLNMYKMTAKACEAI